MAPSKGRIERSTPRTSKKSQAGSARLEELRQTALQIIERTLVRPIALVRSDLAAEGERIRGLYAPLLLDLQERARTAVTLEELDEIMARHARLADLLQQEVQHLASQQERL